MKRTVPREDIGFKGGSKRKKIFVGGIPTSLSDGMVNATLFFSIIAKLIYIFFFDTMVKHCRGIG